MYAITITLLSAAMMIGYVTGLEDSIDCNVLIFMYYPTGIIFLTFLLMSIDKVIAVVFPFRHRKFMKPQVVCGILVAKHLLVVLIYAKNLLFPRSFIKVAQFGVCSLAHDSAIPEALITVTIPMFLTCLITISLDVVLTIKAYQIRKTI